MKYKSFVIEQYIFKFQVSGLSGRVEQKSLRWRVLDKDKKEIKGGFHTTKFAKDYINSLNTLKITGENQ